MVKKAGNYELFFIIKYFFQKSIDKPKIVCYNIKASNGRLAQLGEHLPYKQRVTGSSPVLSTKVKYKAFGLVKN